MIMIEIPNVFTSLRKYFLWLSGLEGKVICQKIKSYLRQTDHKPCYKRPYKYLFTKARRRLTFYSEEGHTYKIGEIFRILRRKKTCLIQDSV